MGKPPKNYLVRFTALPRPLSPAVATAPPRSHTRHTMNLSPTKPALSHSGLRLTAVLWAASPEQARREGCLPRPPPSPRPQGAAPRGPPPPQRGLALRDAPVP